MGTQEFYRSSQSCLCAHPVLPLPLQGLGLFDSRGSGAAVPIRGEGDETLGGEPLVHVLEEGSKPPPGMQDEDPRTMPSSGSAKYPVTVLPLISNSSIPATLPTR